MNTADVELALRLVDRVTPVLRRVRAGLWRWLWWTDWRECFMQTEAATRLVLARLEALR